MITDRIIRSFNIEKTEKFSNFIWSPDSKYLVLIHGWWGCGWSQGRKEKPLRTVAIC